MVTVTETCFDLAQIQDSGQCFRLQQMGPGEYRLVALGQVLTLRQRSDCVELDCSQAEFAAYWRDYFDLQTDYAAIRGLIDPQDTYLQAAADYGAGIRILRQDPWEMLVTFLISQRKRIPAIRTAVEKLSCCCGTPLGQEGLFAFPTLEQLAQLSLEQMQDCGLGYRAAYLHQTVQQVLQGPPLVDLARQEDLQLRQCLMRFSGIGEKVADCILLFGYHRLSAFPRDVWINRTLQARYPKGFPLERYAPYEGLMQQYLFYYARQEAALAK